MGYISCFIRIIKEFLLVVLLYLISFFSNIKKIYVRGLLVFDGCFYLWSVIIVFFMWLVCNGDVEFIRRYILFVIMFCS